MTRRQLCALAAVPLSAQLRKTSKPPGLEAKLPAAPQYSFPPLPPQPRSGGDKSQLDAIGKHRPLPASALKKGRWDKLAGGQRIWRLSIKSPAATGIRLHFTKFDAGAGKVWIYGGPPGDVRVSEPYSGKGTDDSGSFWSDTVYADAVTIECEPAPSAASKSVPPFQITEISHLFR